MPSAPGIQEPVPTLLQQVLRATVLDHARSETRRHYPPVLHVGMPGRPHRSLELGTDDRWDHALRVEALEAMCRASIEREVVPLVWLTRPAEGFEDAEQAWAAALSAAGAELAVRLEFVVITRRSWHDPRSGVERHWIRIRDRRRTATTEPT